MPYYYVICLRAYEIFLSVTVTHLHMLYVFFFNFIHEGPDLNVQLRRFSHHSVQ